MPLSKIDAEDFLKYLIEEPWRLIHANELISHYHEFREDFLNSFSAFVKSRLNDGYQIYKIYSNVYLIENYGDSSLRMIVENLVSAQFYCGSTECYFTVARLNKEFNDSIYFFGFTKKILTESFSSTEKLINIIDNISDNAKVDKIKLIFNCLKILKKDQFFKINLIFESLDLNSKYELLSYSVEYDFDITNNLSYYLSIDKNFNSYCESKFDDDSILIKNILKRQLYELLNLNHIKIFISNNWKKIPISISEIIEKSIEKKYSAILLYIASFYDKRKIFKSLLKINDQSSIDEFIRLYKNDKEVKLLLMFN